MASNQEITYFPHAGVYVSGKQDTLTANSHILARLEINEPDQLNASSDGYPTFKTYVVDPSIQRAAALTAQIKEERRRTGLLTGADETVLGDPLAPLIHIRLHQDILGKQRRHFHLDSAAVKMTVDDIYYRMSFQDNPEASQFVPPRGEYDVNKIEYYESQLKLDKLVTGRDVAWEDKLRVLLDFIQTQRDNMKWSAAYKREKSAAKALTDITATGKTWGNTTGFTNTKPSDAGHKLMPGKYAANATHATQKTANIIQDQVNIFTKTHDLYIDTMICHPKFGMALATNSWTRNNTIFNVEAYRTSGGVRTAPGLDDITMVSSMHVPEDVVYFIAKDEKPFILAQGPTQMKSWDEPKRFTEVEAAAEFFQYKWMPKDFQSKTDRIWGFGMVVDYS